MVYGVAFYFHGETQGEGKGPAPRNCQIQCITMRLNFVRQRNVCLVYLAHWRNHNIYLHQINSNKMLVIIFRRVYNSSIMFRAT